MGLWLGFGLGFGLGCASVIGAAVWLGQPKRTEPTSGCICGLAEGRRAGLAGCCCAACPCAECEAIDRASSPAESEPKAACVCSESGGSSGAPSGPITSRSAPPCEGQCAP